MLRFVVWIELLNGPMRTPRIGRVIPNNPPATDVETHQQPDIYQDHNPFDEWHRAAWLCCLVYRILVKCRTTSLPCKLNDSPLPGLVPKPVSLELHPSVFFWYFQIRDDGIHFGAGFGDRFSDVFLGSFLFFPCATRVMLPKLVKLVMWYTLFFGRFAALFSKPIRKGWEILDDWWKIGGRLVEDWWKIGGRLVEDWWKIGNWWLATCKMICVPTISTLFNWLKETII